MSKFFKVGDHVKLKDWSAYLPIVDVNYNGIRIQQEDAFAWYDTTIHNFEKEEPVKIDMNKKYRRVGTHEPVRVICTDRKDTVIPCIGLYNTGTSEGVIYFNHEGVSGGTAVIEEIPKTGWSKVQVDTLIWVGNTPRYFHAYSTQDDFVCFYKDGATSVTNTNGISLVCSEDCSLEKPDA